METKTVNSIRQVLQLLYLQTKHDFSSYKLSAIYKRILKRIEILQLNSLAHYADYLHQNADEAQTLFKTLLINVTHFFRDPEAFKVLQQALETRLKDKPVGSSIRIWVPGCATGEEAYAIAIILQECMSKLRRYFDIQIFGTDINEDSIKQAQAGLYAETIALEMSAERLERFFVRKINHYQVSADIQKTVIFSMQNVVKDPPFTKLDLLSCRNLLIYFDARLQQKLLHLFQTSLMPSGLLFLGASETIGNAANCFNPVDERWKIFQRHESSTMERLLLSALRV